jgi:dipeptidyl aminopeptidase/acylaminoacyl peptidase
VTEIGPGPSSEQYVSKSFEIDGKKIEYVFVRGGRPPAPWPGLLVVHGERGNARRLLPFARQAAQTGYSVMLVSLPGYGASEGQHDLMGPASASAVEKAYQIMRSEPDVDSTKVAAWGVSFGAGLVARFAARHPELKAVVLQNGVYDLWAVSRARGAEATREFARAAGNDSAGWRERSALLSGGKVSSPVLMLHDERDPSTPLTQARAYADVLRQAGGTVETSFPDGADRPRPVGVSAQSGLDFIERKVAIRKL